MDLIDLLLTILVAIVCGTIAQLTSGYSRGGWLVNLGLGFLGALAGVVLSRMLEAPAIYDLKLGATSFPILYSVIGSVFFLAAIGFFIRPGRR
jgi:uncharacterized membrane protein YeaQ/YmgE (transglycosylase-associated protein family)